MSFPIGITYLSFPGSHHSIGPSRRTTCFGHQSRHLAGPLKELDAETIATPSGQPRLFTFVGSDTGPWTVLSARTLVGDALPPARCLSVVAGDAAPPPSGTPWALAGITSNERYVERHEKVALMCPQAGPGRAEATLAALIPIRESPASWGLTQGERGP